jgi:hypothetical protein
VGLAVFKTVARPLARSWVGSTPMHLRHRSTRPGTRALLVCNATPGSAILAAAGHTGRPRGHNVGILRILLELFQFLVERRAWWMIPIVAGLLMVGLMMVVTQATPLGPFIYSIF